MRILVNTSSTLKGGGIQVGQSLIEEFRKFEEHEFIIVLSQTLSKLIDIEKYPENFIFFIAPFRPATRFFSYRSHNGFLKEIEKKTNPHVVLTTSGPAYWRPKAFHFIGFNLGHYIYTDSPYFEIISLRRRLYWTAMRFFARYRFKVEGDAYFVQTDDVKKRLQKFLSAEKVYTISNTMNGYFNDPIPFDNKLPEKKDGEFRLLTLASWYPHKNLNVIPEVIRHLIEKGYSNVKFILTIDEKSYLDSEFDIFENICNLGYIRSEEAPSLYHECDAMFLPSLIECFSASYAEAMVMNIPILTSELDFAKIVCGEAAVYFNPIDPNDISDKIIHLISSPQTQANVKEEGQNRLKMFRSAEERASDVIDYLSECLR